MTGSTEVCNYCSIGYGVVPLIPNTCSVCDINTERNCQAVNNCSNTSTCAVCNRYSLNAASNCLLCNLIYRNCNLCNNSVCLYCYAGHALNASAGSILSMM